MSNTIEAESRSRRPEFRIALFGVNDKCQHALEVVSRHVLHNPYGYRVAESRRAEAFDFAIVDMTVAGGPEVANTLGLIAAGRPVVRLGRRGDPARVCDDIMLDGFARHVLGGLNRFVAAHPELLGAAASPAAGSKSAHARRPVVERVAARLGVDCTAADRRASNRVAADSSPAAEPIMVCAATASDVAPASVEIEPPELAELVWASRRPRALIVDDSSTVRHQLTVALRQMGMESDAADSAEQAMALLTTRTYELVFADVVMPGKDGYQFTREIKKNRTLKDVPVIILTSRSSPFDLVRGALAGCSSYLVKPVSLQSLRDTVNRQLKRAVSKPGLKDEALMGVA